MLDPAKTGQISIHDPSAHRKHYFSTLSVNCKNQFLLNMQSEKGDGFRIPCIVLERIPCGEAGQLRSLLHQPVQAHLTFSEKQEKNSKDWKDSL